MLIATAMNMVRPCEITTICPMSSAPKWNHVHHNFLPAVGVWWVISNGHWRDVVMLNIHHPCQKEHVVYSSTFSKIIKKHWKKQKVWTIAEVFLTSLKIVEPHLPSQSQWHIPCQIPLQKSGRPNVLPSARPLEMRQHPFGPGTLVSVGEGGNCRIPMVVLW